jgi:transcription initiation factor TFIID TATA-box-binding protein
MEAIFLPTKGKTAHDLRADANSMKIEVVETAPDSLRIRATSDEINSFIESKHAKLGIAIENIVATINLGQTVDLNKLRSIPGAQYNKSRFPGLIFRPVENTEVTFLIFKSGKVVCVGAESAQILKNATKILCSGLRDAKIIAATKVNPAQIVNIVAQVILKGKIDIREAVSTLTRIIYEPEQFPGAVYQMLVPTPAVFLLFESGRVICLKACNEQDLKVAGVTLDRSLREHGLLYTEKSGLLLPE